MNVAFRVDASPQIGTGHFMRCLTLANALKRRGAKTLFVSRHLPKYLIAMLNAARHDFASIHSAARAVSDCDLSHAEWLGTDQVSDALDTLKALSGPSWDWLVVDHYALDARWEVMLRESTKWIAVIDDIADRIHDCDLLLDQNLQKSGERYRGKAPANCKMLLGPRFALLRKEFPTLRDGVKPRQGAVGRILIFFGGADVDNYTGQAVEAIAALGILDLHVDVVIGSSHPRRDQIAAQCLRHGFVCHVQTDRMAELIAAADLAIGAGGTATWERCCLGLPALAICIAENQRDQIAAAADAGLLYAPESKDECMLLIRRHAKALIENPLLRHLISRMGMQAVDGQGVWRVVDNMTCGDIEIRTASSHDSRNLFEWRNDPSVRSVSRMTEPIDWNTHQDWLASVLNAPTKSLLIGQREGSPVGVVRFDTAGADAEISIYLVPGLHPPGEGRSLLQSAERWLTSNRPEVDRICAHVLAGNERSGRLFLGAGYQADSSIYSKRLGGR